MYQTGSPPLYHLRFPFFRRWVSGDISISFESSALALPILFENSADSLHLNQTESEEEISLTHGQNPRLPFASENKNSCFMLRSNFRGNV